MNFFGQDFSVVEVAGTMTGLTAVVLTMYEKRWCFPIGILSCLLYAWVFFSPGIRFYADAVLQVIYIALLIYGWLHWSSKKEDVPVTRCSLSLRWKATGLIIAGTGIIGFAFYSMTNASLPFIDAFTTSLSLVAQWMVAKKKIENWPIWIIANVVYIGMYIHKNLYFTSFYYYALLIIAIIGWLEWKKHLKFSS